VADNQIANSPVFMQVNFNRSHLESDKTGIRRRFAMNRSAIPPSTTAGEVHRPTSSSAEQEKGPWLESRTRSLRGKVDY